MRLMIIVPDGIGIKNYLYSDFIQKLFDANISVHIVTKLNTDFVKELYVSPLYNVYPLSPFKETFAEVLVRETVKYARLKLYAKNLKNKTILNAKSVGINLQKKLFLGASELAGSILCILGNKAIDRTEKLYGYILSKRKLDNFEAIFRDVNPDIIISTHQRPVDNIPMFEQARRLGITRTSVIYSWDNVAKFSLNTPSEYYFLWSDFMLNQMKLFYPAINTHKFVITGTPQFSFYFDPAYMWEKADFFNEFKIPLHKKFIIFSGSDLKTSPYDPALLQDVISAIRQLPEPDRPVLIFRRSPADFSGRYDKVLKENSEIIAMDPLWTNKGNSWATAIPTKADIRNIVGLVQHCNIIINVCSTMAIDGATHNKPCIYLAYSPKDAAHFDYEKIVHGEDHFKILHNIDAVSYVKSHEQLFPLIKGILSQPDKYCTEKAEMLNRITNNILTDASDRMVEALKDTYLQRLK